tara:strand:+ start:855 stop:1034 length:180 start_codon:yes stop_codon:yes gene_type:complete
MQKPCTGKVVAVVFVQLAEKEAPSQGKPEKTWGSKSKQELNRLTTEAPNNAVYNFSNRS